MMPMQEVEILQFRYAGTEDNENGAGGIPCYETVS
jgi:hypothetical protein